MPFDALPSVASCDSDQILVGVFFATADRAIRRWLPSQVNSLLDISIPTVALVLVLWHSTRNVPAGS